MSLYTLYPMLHEAQAKKKHPAIRTAIEAGDQLIIDVTCAAKKDLPTPAVESVSVVCDSCGEELWASHEVLRRAERALDGDLKDAIVWFLCMDDTRRLGLI